MSEGSADAHLYGATFHRHTAAIALGLAAGTQITVEGYPHANWDRSGKRMDTLSVINLLAYPGKPEGRRPKSARRKTAPIASLLPALDDTSEDRGITPDPG